MGLLQMIANAFGFSRRQARVLVIGLDNSGKTTLINHLNPTKKSVSAEVTPTVGFQVEEFTKGSINFTVYDMSGQGRYRNLWETYYADVEAIIFVLDSTDKVRMCVAKDELDQLLNHADIKASLCPMLFFANKVRSQVNYTFSLSLFVYRIDSLLTPPPFISLSLLVDRK